MGSLLKETFHYVMIERQVVKLIYFETCYCWIDVLADLSHYQDQKLQEQIWNIRIWKLVI